MIISNEMAQLFEERDKLKVAIADLRVERDELRAALSQLLYHFWNTKRGEWLNAEGYMAAKVAEDKANAVLMKGNR